MSMSLEILRAHAFAAEKRNLENSMRRRDPGRRIT
jgi:hypothetical protein